MLVKKKKSFKVIIKRLLRKIGSFLVSLKDNFMKLNPTARRVIYVWFIVAVVTLLLAACANSNAKRLDKYAKFEQDFSKAATAYVKDMKMYPNADKKMQVDLELLLDEKYLSDKEAFDDTCRGFSIVYYDETAEDYVTNSFINCKHYTSKDYAKEKIE